MLQAKGKGKTTFEPVKTEPEYLTQPQDGVKEKTNIVTEPTRTTVVDLERVPAVNLLPVVEGSSWPLLAYYRRLMGKNDPKMLFDPKQDTPVQQYDCIHYMELRVNSPLSRDQDGSNKTFTMSGSATMATTVAPNENDIFTASLKDNRVGIFNVTSSTRNSNNKVATYTIEYTLLFEMTPAHKAILDKCTAHEYYYVKERAFTGGDTLLTPNEYNMFLALGEHVNAIEETYLRRFFNEDAQTILFPDDRYGYAYDVFLAQFVRDIGLRMVGKDVRIYPHPTKPIRDIETLFSVIMAQQPLFLQDVNRKNKALSVRSFRTMQTYNNVGWSKIAVTRYFSDDAPLRQMPAEWPKFDDLTSEEVLLEGTDEALPGFLPLTYTPYLLSDAFYSGGYTSGLEYALQAYLNKQPVATKLVLDLAKQVHRLPKNAQLYYVPLMYVLLKYVR